MSTMGRTVLLLAAAVIAAPHAFAQSTSGSLEDFQLPPGKKALPEAQGPATPNHPVFSPPSKPVQPTPAVPVATPPLPNPETVTSEPESKPDAQPAETTRQQSVAEPTVEARPHITAEPSNQPDAAAHSAPTQDTPTAVQPPAPPAQTSKPSRQEAVPISPREARRGFDWWTYLIALILLIPMGIGGWMFWQQRRRQPTPIFVRPIERPKPRTPVRPQEQQPESTVEDIFADDENLVAAPLRHALETTNLGITLINATLSYQLTLTNASRQMMRDIAVTGDIISAHASLPMEVQLAGPDKAAAPLHQVSVLLPGQSTFLSGEVRLPLGTIRPLRRDNAVMFIPLLRLRITGMGLDHEIIQTCVVGQRPAGPGAGLRPFRLDTGPRIYADIGMRTLDAPAAAVA